MRGFDCCIIIYCGTAQCSMELGQSRSGWNLAVDEISPSSHTLSVTGRPVEKIDRGAAPNENMSNIFHKHDTLPCLLPCNPKRIDVTRWLACLIRRRPRQTRKIYWLRGIRMAQLPDRQTQLQAVKFGGKVYASYKFWRCLAWPTFATQNLQSWQAAS